MSASEELFETYLFETLGISIHLTHREKGVGLPLFLHDLYHIYTCQMLGRLCLVLAVRSAGEISPARVGKHVAKAGEFEPDADVIYLHPAISPFNRKRLIARKIPFVVPGKQMYLPFLGVDLREFLRKNRSEKPARFRPSTQAAFLAALYASPGKPITPSGLAVQLGYSPMAMSRAFDEIQAAGVGHIASQGRHRVLSVPENRQKLFVDALSLLTSPVRKRLKLSGDISLSGLVLAGESALSSYGMLSEPIHPVYASGPKTWKLKEHTEDIMSVPVHEGDSIEVEIWRYPPELLARNDVADPLSLYLSLLHVRDERVETALEGLLEELVW